MSVHPMAELLRREEKLLPELKPYEYEGPIGLGVHHPLIIELTYDSEHAALINERYRQKKVAVEAARKEGHWSRFIFFHERPYRFQALMTAKAAGALNLAELVGEVWADSENIWQYKKGWFEVWKALADPWAAMDEDDQAAFATLPDTIQVFRGVRHVKHSPKGLSWTTDRNKAIWFAKRWPDKKLQPTLLGAWVNKIDVLAHFTGRHEGEIVVLPTKLKAFTKLKLEGL